MTDGDRHLEPLSHDAGKQLKSPSLSRAAARRLIP